MNIDIRLWYKQFKGYIDIKYLILLVLAGLHYNKKITDAKLKGQFRSLRAGMLQNKKTTYRCDITSRWYNDESPYEVFLDCIEDKGLKLIPYEEFIKYIQLFENKSFNHCLNIFGSEYLYRMLNQWNPEYLALSFSDYIELRIPNVEAQRDSHSCYECGHSYSIVSKNEKKNVDTISQWLHDQKKGNKQKIPFHKIDTKYSH